VDGDFTFTDVTLSPTTTDAGQVFQASGTINNLTDLPLRGPVTLTVSQGPPYYTHIRVRHAKSPTEDGTAHHPGRNRGGILRSGAPHPAIQTHRGRDTRPVYHRRDHLICARSH